MGSPTHLLFHPLSEAFRPSNLIMSTSRSVHNSTDFSPLKRSQYWHTPRLNQKRAARLYCDTIDKSYTRPTSWQSFEPSGTISRPLQRLPSFFPNSALAQSLRFAGEVTEYVSNRTALTVPSSIDQALRPCPSLFGICALRCLTHCHVLPLPGLGPLSTRPPSK